MTSTSQPTDITVRGRTVNVPHSTKPIHPPRHQPNTPATKKQTKPRPDHIPHVPDPTPPPDKPPVTAEAPPAPASDEDQGD